MKTRTLEHAVTVQDWFLSDKVHPLANRSKGLDYIMPCHLCPYKKWIPITLK